MRFDLWAISDVMCGATASLYVIFSLPSFWGVSPLANFYFRAE